MADVMLQNESHDDRPVLLFDGQCPFCRFWVDRWSALTGWRIIYEPYQRAIGRYPSLSEAELANSVHLVESDGRVTRGAAAVFRAAYLAGVRRWAWWCYRHLPGFAIFTEALYRLISNHRPAAWRATRWLTRGANGYGDA